MGVLWAPVLGFFCPRFCRQHGIVENPIRFLAFETTCAQAFPLATSAPAYYIEMWQRFPFFSWPADHPARIASGYRPRNDSDSICLVWQVFVGFFHGGFEMQDAGCCVADTCKIEIDPAMAKQMDETIQERIRCRLELFAYSIEQNKELLEIDGLSIDGEPCQEVTEKSRIKVLNHKTQDAVEVEIDTVVKTPLEILIPALVSGEYIKLYGVTRIVGYYSRIHNWNKSKIGELKDRHMGNYGVKRTSDL